MTFIHPLLMSFLFLLLPWLAAHPGGEPAGETPSWLSGYERTIEGRPFSYHAPLSEVRTSLLVRCHRVGASVAWETASLPADYAAGRAHFVWLFGVDVMAERHTFSLMVNGKHCLTFENPADSALKDWEASGAGGALLRFRPTMIDRHGDLMGFAMLSLPAGGLERGEPVRLAVSGDGTGSAAWYMTFRHTLSEGLRFRNTPAIVKRNGGEFQEVVLEFLHMDAPAQARIAIDGETEIARRLDFGQNSVPILIPPVEEPRPLTIRAEVAGRPERLLSVTVDPVRRWTVYLVQHTHSDVGYTRPQTEILPDHLRFIDYALDYCDATDGFPDAAKFRWTCESSWAVREWLESRPPGEIARLRQRVAEGRIELTAMFLNMSELPDEVSFAAFLAPLRQMRRHGLTVQTAMQNDVNGIAWCLADIFPKLGIEAFVMGQHTHRAVACFTRPTAFWWESPAGERLLGFRADHYMTGNKWGIHTGDLERFKGEVFGYLHDLSEGGYPHDRVAVQYSGSLTDNAPPGLAGPEMIRSWNEAYAWPRLRSATAGEFPAFLAEHHGGELPVCRGAWPDWWTDGTGSAPLETATARRVHAEMIAVEGLYGVAACLGVDCPDGVLDEIQAVYEAVLFYDEHTFGAAESIRDPDCENSRVQWGEKAAYVWDAAKRARLLREAGLGRVQGLFPRCAVPTITVVNTLGFERSGRHELFIDHEILPRDRTFRIAGPGGEEAAAQLVSSRSDGSTWTLWLERVPALGFTTYRIEVEDAPRPPLPTYRGNVLENAFYRMSIDPATGTVASLVDKQTGIELVDDRSEWGMLAFIHETLGDRHQLEAFRLNRFDRTTLDGVSLTPGVDGPIWRSLVVTGSSPACSGDEAVRYEIRLFNVAKRIEFHFSCRKKGGTDPEGLYVAFPFGLRDGEFAYEAQGALVVPGVDQLPGSASDWHTVQNFLRLRNDAIQVVMGSDEIPLVQFGGINLGEFRYVAKVELPHVYSWVMNNYWTTNFRAELGGEFRWHYFLTSMTDRSHAAAARFGWGSRVPFLSRVLPAGPVRGEPVARSFLGPVPENLHLVACRPAAGGQGLILHWRETAGVATSLDVRKLLKGTPFSDFSVVNIIGEKLEAVASEVTFGPLEVRFLKAGLVPGR